MKTAKISGVIIAESAQTIVVEGNDYFPPSSLKRELYEETELTTVCPWKGTANYYSITVEDVKHKDVAWTYHTPKEAASEIKDYVAFYPAVTVS